MRLTIVLPTLLAGCLAAFDRARAIDRVDFHRDGQAMTVTGKLQVKAADGGLLVLARDGVLWSVPPDELILHETNEVAFEPFDSKELKKRLRDELPRGFQFHETAHFLICYGTSRAYGQWCGALFERLYKAFTNYWRRSGFNLREPEFPLVAIVFPNRNSYADFARGELGDSVESIIGYYSFRSNRMTMYDLTGSESLRRPGDRRGTASAINRILARPEAERTVATIIHEATHQIAFNCGLQTRYADIPLWVSEGIAVYFETPDLGSSRGWSNIGAVNRMRLSAFRDYLPRRPPQSLETLVADDTRFRDPRRANDAYGEAWAFNYFLLHEKQRRQQYHAYLAMLSKKGPLIWDDREARLEAFKQAFGPDLREIDAEFLRHMSKVR